jgi:hypothetical protein
MSSVSRFAGIAAVIAILVAGVAIGASRSSQSAGPSLSPSAGPSTGPSVSPTPDPTASTRSAGSFVRPFRFTVPAGSGLQKTIGDAPPEIVSFVVGANAPIGGQSYGGQAPESGNLRGIVIASAETAWTHGAGGRFALRPAPADFLADLHTKAIARFDDLGTVVGIDLSATTDTILDGRPALTAATRPGGKTGLDIHVQLPMTGLGGGPLISLKLPYRLIVTEVDGVTVLVQIWARSDADLAAWMPDATKFVDSIRFVEQPSPSGAPSATSSASPAAIVSEAPIDARAASVNPCDLVTVEEVQAARLTRLQLGAVRGRWLDGDDSCVYVAPGASPVDAQGNSVPIVSIELLSAPNMLSYWSGPVDGLNVAVGSVTARWMPTRGAFTIFRGHHLPARPVFALYPMVAALVFDCGRAPSGACTQDPPADWMARATSLARSLADRLPGG